MVREYSEIENKEHITKPEEVIRTIKNLIRAIFTLILLSFLAACNSRSNPVWAGLRNLEEDLQCPG